MDVDDLTAIMAQLTENNLQLVQSVTGLTQQIKDINQQHTQAAATFALTPAQHDPGLINYSSKHGSSIFRKSTEGLEDKFNFDDAGLMPFLNVVTKRSQDSSWNRTITSFTPAAGQDPINIMNQYGMIAMERLQTLCAPFISGGDMHTRTGSGQLQLFHLPPQLALHDSTDKDLDLQGGVYRGRHS